MSDETAERVERPDEKEITVAATDPGGTVPEAIQEYRRKEQQLIDELGEEQLFLIKEHKGTKEVFEKSLYEFIVAYNRSRDNKEPPLSEKKTKNRSTAFDDLEKAKSLTERNFRFFQSTQQRIQEAFGPQVVNKQELTVFLSELLFEGYGIRPQILATDDEYYSPEIAERTIREKVYFISTESPIETSRTTEVLIRHNKLKHELMHANRVERASTNNMSIGAKIQEIKNEYSQSHNGREPALNTIAKILNERGEKTPNGKRTWYAETIKRVLERTQQNHLE